MTKEEFIDFYCSNTTDPTRQRARFEGDPPQVVVLPCYCEDASCQGWAAVRNDPGHIKDHMTRHGNLPQGVVVTMNEPALCLCGAQLQAMQWHDRYNAGKAPEYRYRCPRCTRGTAWTRTPGVSPHRTTHRHCAVTLQAESITLTTHLDELANQGWLFVCWLTGRLKGEPGSRVALLRREESL